MSQRNGRGRQKTTHRGTCISCKREFALRVDRTVPYHRKQLSTDYCNGSGMRPKNERLVVLARISR